MSEILELIKGISDIFTYIIPGALLIFVFDFFTSKHIGNEKFFLVKCIVYSAIIRGIFAVLHTIPWFSIITIPWNITSFLLSVVALFLGALFAWIYERNWFDKLISHINGKSIYTDIFPVIFGETGSTLKVKMNDGRIFLGQLSYYEEKGKESWISLENYKIVGEKDGNYSSSACKNVDAFLIFCLSDVQTIEVFKSSVNN